MSISKKVGYARKVKTYRILELVWNNLLQLKHILFEKKCKFYVISSAYIPDQSNEKVNNYMADAYLFIKLTHIIKYYWDKKYNFSHTRFIFIRKVH